MMTDILNCSYDELKTMMRDLGEPSFRADQVWQWLWQKGARSFDAMTNVSKATRASLARRCAICLPAVEKVRVSSDGTTKFLLSLQDGELVETVLIPSESQDGKERMTQCLSSQVGCSMGCTFCATGKNGFTRNMTMAEILGQVLIAREYLQDSPENPRLRNLVFMGMGEPLLNLSEILRSLKTLHSEKGLNFSPRRITVSTCGVKNGLQQLGESGLAYLAVSLHAPNQELRRAIMPKAAAWPLEEMMDFLASYPLKARERLTFEYLLLGGVNDSPAHARELAKLMSRVKAKLNLIVYNPVEGSPYAAPDPQRVLEFERLLWSKNITAVLRKSKGQDIKAACGQLRAEKLRSI